jgi:tetratricopeptide (TPR) repeat protein
MFTRQSARDRQHRIGIAFIIMVTTLICAEPCSGWAQLLGPGTVIDTQGPCSPGVVAGRDAHVELTCGMTPEEVGRAIAAAMGQPIEITVEKSDSCRPEVYAQRQAVVSVVCGVQPAEVGRTIAAATAQIRTAFDDFRKRAGLTEAAARRVLEDLGQQNVPTEELPVKLADAVSRYHELLSRLQSFEGGAPELARSREQAREAIQRGDLDKAEVILQKVREERRETSRQLREALQRVQLDEAEDAANLGLLAELRFRYADAAERFREAADLCPDSEGQRQAGYLHSAALAAWRGGEYAKAEPLLSRALAIDEREFGPNDLVVATDLNDLGVVLGDLSRPSDAERLHRRALSIREQVLGPTDPVVATSLNNLATALVGLQRLAEAERLLRRALSIREQAFGSEQPIVAGTLQNLSTALSYLHRPSEAEPLLRRAVAIYEKKLGPEQLDLATALGNLGVTLDFDLRRHAEAEPLFRRALSIREHLLGSDHPETAQSLNNLAVNLMRLCRPVEAKPLEQRALAVRERVFGHDDPRTVAVRTNLEILASESLPNCTSPKPPKALQ